MWDKHWSEQIAKQAVWLSGLVEFAHAAEILKRVGQVTISDGSVWRRTDEWGEQCKAVEATQRATATALPPRSAIVRGEALQPTDMGVAMDGAMVPVREEGWKELKTGCVFEIELRRVLARADFFTDRTLPNRMREKHSPTEHLPKGFNAHQREPFTHAQQK